MKRQSTDERILQLRQECIAYLQGSRNLLNQYHINLNTFTETLRQYQWYITSGARGSNTGGLAGDIAVTHRVIQFIEKKGDILLQSMTKTFGKLGAVMKTLNPNFTQKYGGEIGEAVQFMNLITNVRKACGETMKHFRKADREFANERLKYVQLG